MQQSKFDLFMDPGGGSATFGNQMYGSGGGGFRPFEPANWDPMNGFDGGSKLPGSGGNQWYANLPGMPGGNPNAGAYNPGQSSSAGTGNYINPYLIDLGEGFGTMTPISPSLTSGFMGYLQSQLGQGASPYGGQLSADMNPLLAQLQKMFMGGPSSLPGMDVLGQIGKGGGPGGSFLQSIAGGKDPASRALLELIHGGGAGGDVLSRLAATGLPTDVGPAWEAMKAAQQRQIEQGGAEMKQQFNFGGGLAGSPFGNAIGDYYSQAGKDLNSILAQMSVGAQEAARGRQLSAGEILRGGALQGAGTLGGLESGAASTLQGNALQAGAQRANAGLGFMQEGTQLGSLMQGIQQSGLDRQYQEFLRTRPEYNPLLNLMFGSSTTFPPILGGQQGGGGAGSMMGGIGGLMGGTGGLITAIAL